MFPSLSPRTLLLTPALLLACWLPIPSGLIHADTYPPALVLVSEQNTVRDVEMKIEVIPKTKTVRLTITNHSPEKRYIWTPLGLRQYHIDLTDDSGHALKMTPRGIEDLTEFANGSNKISELGKGVPKIALIDLEKLLEFPQSGTIHCEISRLIHFTDPSKFGDFLNSPAEKEWLKFPPLSVVVEPAALPSPEK